jgi:hypothetical protein
LRVVEEIPRLWTTNAGLKEETVEDKRKVAIAVIRILDKATKLLPVCCLERLERVMEHDILSE